MDIANKYFNENAIEKWNIKMLNVTQPKIRVPRSILNKYAYHMWFGINLYHTYVRPKYVSKDTFKMKALPYYMFEEKFHNEVLSRSGIQCMQIIDGIF